MRNKYRKEEWSSNLRFYQDLFRANSFKEFSTLINDNNSPLESTTNTEENTKEEKYRMRKRSGQGLDSLRKRADSKEYSEINTIKQHTYSNFWKKKPKLESLEEQKEKLYISEEFSAKNKSSEKSDLFDTSSSIDSQDDPNKGIQSIETSRENQDIRNLIEQCIVEANGPNSGSEEENPYQDPFINDFESLEKINEENLNLQMNSEKEIQKDIFKTSFIKFRDVKHLQSYDFDTQESNFVWNPLKESMTAETDSSDFSQPQSFSLKRTCFEKIENKLVYAMTEAFRSSARNIEDKDLLQLIQGIFQRPGDEDVVRRFFKKGRQELEVSQKYLWKFHLVCKDFLSLEKEGLQRRQVRYVKTLRDFAIRKFVKDNEITIIKRSEEDLKEGSNFQSYQDSQMGHKISGTSSGVPGMRRTTSTTKIESKVISQREIGYHNRIKARNSFYLVRKESRNSNNRRVSKSQKMPRIYIQPLILKAFRSTIYNSGGDGQMISALNVNDYFSQKSFAQVEPYTEDGKIFEGLKEFKHIIFSVQNMLEMFEIIFDRQKHLFEMKVKTNMIDYFLKKRFEVLKGQMMGTFEEIHLSSYFKEIHNLRDVSNHRYLLLLLVFLYHYYSWVVLGQLYI